MGTERKRGFTKPRGTLPEWVREGGLIYNDTEYPFRYVFETAASGYAEVQSEDGSWAKTECKFRKYRRRELADTLLECRKEVAEELVGWLGPLIIACAIEAVGGQDIVHIVIDDGTSTWCGISISNYYASQRTHGVRRTTTDVTKITCRECRMKVINAVNAMPFLG